MIKYYPYKTDKPNKKYYIITNDNKKVNFGPLKDVPPIPNKGIPIALAFVFGNPDDDERPESIHNTGQV